ncbi:Pectinesterase [Dactylellina cionopaga]|nr:Pectinesterase [Dactylellina cionopaga]
MHYKTFAALGTLIPLVAAQSPLYGQCGGIGWTGPTTCVSGAVCVYSNDWYSQCLTGTATTTKATTAAATTTKATTTTAAAATGAVHTSPPSGAIVVRQSGTKSGEFSSLFSALASLSTTDTTAKTIFIYQGTYEGRVEIIYKGPLTIIGYTTNSYSYSSNTVTVQHNSGDDAGSLDNSATMRIDNKQPNFRMYNVNVRNLRGQGTQAVAVSAKSIKGGFYGCGFYGYQDTLFADNGYQYFANCYIEGAVDYIFGHASAWYNKCTIRSNGGGAITATSREVATDPSWYVFESCTVDKVSGSSVAAGAVYLGRPWRVLSRVLYQRCTLSNIINAKGWTEMAANATPLYYEYQNTGAGASTSGRKYLTSTSVSLTKAQLYANDVSWIDSAYPS